jgi:3-oxoacyl-[acyl-carrier-protein] synthase III
MRSSKISALSYSVPDTELTHAELQNRFGKVKMDRLAESTDIYNRRVCAPDQVASDLAFEAAEKILSSGDVARGSIDLLIVATQMPDYLLPTTACILQARLGLPQNCAAFDINLGCSQFVYAHSVAHSMISAGLANRALVLTCDNPSKIVDANDVTVVPLFGDGATATILDADETGAGYQDFILGSDGSAHEALIWPGSGMRKADGEMQTATSAPMVMDGQKIFLFTLQTVPKYIQELMERNSLTAKDIDFFALHQASGMIVSSVARKLKLAPDQYNRIYRNYGNSGGSTVGISLCHAIADGSLKPQTRIVMSAFGVGLSWANSLYKVGAELPKLY